MKYKAREVYSLLKYPNTTKIVLSENDKIFVSDYPDTEKSKYRKKSVGFRDLHASFNYSISQQYKIKQGEVVW